jgi:hypothetical protein
LSLVGLDDVRDVKLLTIVHEIGEQDTRGSKLPFRGFKSPPPIDIKDFEMSLLHIIFYLKCVLVGKEYFPINHLLLMPYIIGLLCTLLNKKVIPRLGFKEFLMRCIK